MKSITDLILHPNFQLPMMIAAYTLISWPVITGSDYSLAALFQHVFLCWALLPLLRLLTGAIRNSGKRR